MRCERSNDALCFVAQIAVRCALTFTGDCIPVSQNPTQGNLLRRLNPGKDADLGPEHRGQMSDCAVAVQNLASETRPTKAEEKAPNNGDSSSGATPELPLNGVYLLVRRGISSSALSAPFIICSDFCARAEALVVVLF
jgi:hypothetical protein